MRISDWSSDVCSSDLAVEVLLETLQQAVVDPAHDRRGPVEDLHHLLDAEVAVVVGVAQAPGQRLLVVEAQAFFVGAADPVTAESQAAERVLLASPRAGLVEWRVRLGGGTVGTE